MFSDLTFDTAHDRLGARAAQRFIHVSQFPEQTEPRADLKQHPLIRGQSEKPVSDSEHFRLVAREFAPDLLKQVHNMIAYQCARYSIQILYEKPDFSDDFLV